MGLSQFPAAMGRLASAVISTAEAIREIQSSVGPVPIGLLDRLQSGLRGAKAASYETMAEYAKQPTAAGKMMADVGGPATLADFQDKIGALEVKASAWNTALSGYLSQLTGADLLALEIVDADGVSTKHIKRRNTASVAVSDAIRADPALADLLVAFEEAGA